MERLFPATYVLLPPECEGRRAAFYLAAEEYVAATMPEGNYVMTWQIGPTVVMGRNQDAQAEIDLPFCRAEGIDVIRRKSGGGSIYADRGNIMTSLITGSGAVEPIFAEYATAVAGCLSALEAGVEVSGRNDIRMTDGGKICGNAFYHLSNRNIVHGTMLYDTDARRMRGALTPERAKLLSKGVKSVESRISLLKDALPQVSVTELREHIRQHLTNATIVLGEHDIQRIQEIEAGYYVPSYLYGKDATHGETHRCSNRIEGCGTVSLEFCTEDGRVQAVTVRGDYFEFGNANTLFHQTFYGCPFYEDALLHMAETHRPHESIRGLTLSALNNLISGALSAPQHAEALNQLDQLVQLA